MSRLTLSVLPAPPPSADAVALSPAQPRHLDSLARPARNKQQQQQQRGHHHHRDGSPSRPAYAPASHLNSRPPCPGTLSRPLSTRNLSLPLLPPRECPDRTLGERVLTEIDAAPPTHPRSVPPADRSRPPWRSSSRSLRTTSRPSSWAGGTSSPRATSSPSRT